MDSPQVTYEQAQVLAAHAVIVQGGFSTPEIERDRILKDASRQDDPQEFIDSTVAIFKSELRGSSVGREGDS
jgi:hypothetical protein